MRLAQHARCTGLNDALPLRDIVSCHCLHVAFITSWCYFSTTSFSMFHVFGRKFACDRFMGNGWRLYYLGPIFIAPHTEKLVVDVIKPLVIITSYECQRVLSDSYSETINLQNSAGEISKLPSSDAKGVLIYWDRVPMRVIRMAVIDVTRKSVLFTEYEGA